MSVRYNCHHLADPGPSLSSSHASSSSSHHPLSSLYFCEECDAIRCDLCVAVEVASYFCPNCLFDVPSANVRGDLNRCARNCFSCPTCETSLSVQAVHSTASASAEIRSVETNSTNAPSPAYLLVCSGCKWSSKKVGWTFEKATGLALQVQKMNTQAERVQAEFDALKDHLGAYLTASAPIPPPLSAKSKTAPTRHISHLTQMAAKALHREVPGISAPARRIKHDHDAREKWDDIPSFLSKNTCRGVAAEVLGVGEDGERAKLDRVWGDSWAGSRLQQSVLPQRIKLRTKLTKRCPHPNCRHLLIQPDTKSTRMKIKMVAANYLPALEVGRRRRVVEDTDAASSTLEDMERRRRERRKTRLPLREEDEELSATLRPGEVYTFRLAFTNPLYDPIQIRLTQPKSSLPTDHHLYIPTQHFTVSALKDAWAYDEEEDEEHGAHGLGAGGEEASEEGSGSIVSGARGSSMSKRSRLSVLGMSGGNVRDKRGREPGVEKKGNVSKVGLEVEIMPGARGAIETDLEVRYTYRADEAEGGEEKKEYKTFTFWVRVHLGMVAASSQ